MYCTKPGINNRGNYAGGGREKGIYEFFILSAEFFGNPKTALKT